MSPDCMNLNRRSEVWRQIPANAHACASAVLARLRVRARRVATKLHVFGWTKIGRIGAGRTRSRGVFRRIHLASGFRADCRGCLTVANHKSCPSRPIDYSGVSVVISLCRNAPVLRQWGASIAEPPAQPSCTATGIAKEKPRNSCKSPGP